MSKEAIKTGKAPEAIGPYSQAIKSGDFIFCSGQIPLAPDGVLVEGNIELQIRQVMNNIKEVLEAAGTDFSTVLKTTIFLTDLSDFQKVNEVYAEYFDEPYPARSTVGVAALPRGARIEMEVIAKVS